MSYFNSVTLVGEVTEDPQILKSQKGREYLVVNMRTGKVVGTGSNAKWIFQTHRVVCFKKNFIEVAKKLIGRGVWIKVQGELSYFRGGNSVQITVHEGEGIIGVMSVGNWPATENMTDEEIQAVEAAGGGQSEMDAVNDLYKDGEAAGSCKDPEDDEIPF